MIEPAVYWRVFALDYQAEQFEVFHDRELGKGGFGSVYRGRLSNVRILWRVVLLQCCVC